MAIEGPAKGERQSFGALLKRYRLAAGLSQEALAERARLSARAISAHERELRRAPYRDTVGSLVQALGLSEGEAATLEAAVSRGRGRVDSPELRGSAPPPRRSRLAGAPSPPLVGRARELALLERHLAGEGPPLLLLAGEPGIGKSRLLRETASGAAQRGWQVLEGGCGRRGGQEPYSPLLEALERLTRRRAPAQLCQDLRGCAWLVRLLPELAAGPIEPLPRWTLTPEQERRLLFKAVARLLANVAGPAGTLLVLDDLQWAGTDALDLLAALLEPTAEVPVRLVGAYRTTEAQPHDPLGLLLTDLVGADLLVHHPLSALSTAEAACLLDILLAQSEDAGGVPREQILGRAGGVPFFLISYARGLQTGVQPAEVPWDVGQSIRQRVAALPQGARAILGLAAVAGRMVGGELLAGAATVPEGEVLAALELACRAQLLEDAGVAGYRFVHDVIRDVVEADLGTAQRAVLHRRIAEALERGTGEGPVEMLAYHYARSTAPGQAVPYLEQAGDRARAWAAHAAAVGHYQELVDLLERAGRALEGAAAREKWGAVLVTTARYDAALVVLECAAETYRAAGDLESLGRTTAHIADACVWKGTPEEGVARVRALLPQLEARGPSAGLARLHTALAELLALSGRYDLALEAAEGAVALACEIQDQHILSRAEYERGTALSMLGRQEEAHRALETAIAHAEAVDNLASLHRALDMMGCLYEERGEYALSRVYSERALAVAVRLGDPVAIAFQRSRRGMSAFFTGDWIGARDDYESALALDREVGASWVSPYLLLNLGRLCWVEGAWEAATPLLEESCGLSTCSGNRDALRWAQVVLAERDVVFGQAEAACVRIVPLLDQAAQEVSNVVLLISTLAWANLELGQLKEADALIANVIGRARTMSNRRVLPEVLRVQALVRAREGRWAEAEGALEEGLSLARAMPYPYAEARLLQVYGNLHAERGEPDQAREHLAAALAIFRRLGARKDIERTEELLTALG